MGSLKRRLQQLEAQNPDPAELADFGDSWPLEDQLAQVADTLDLYIHFHSGDDIQYPATDRELHLLGLLCVEKGLNEDAAQLPEWVWEHVKRMEPKDQAERDRWLCANRERPFVSWRERVRRHEEAQKRRAEESRRRDRELLERNRAAVGLPPLEEGNCEPG